MIDQDQKTTLVPNPATIVIVHDIFGGATMDWIPTVKSSLESMGHHVITPALPTGLLASYTLWKSSLVKTLEQIPQKSILVGHGIGGNILLSLMSEKDYSPAMLILIDTPHTLPEHAGYRKLSQSFFVEPFLWEQINKQTEQIYTLYSTNDPFVNKISGEEFYKKIGSSYLEVGEKGHITAADSILDFPELVDIIQQYDQKIIDSLNIISQTEKEVRDTQLLAANTPGLHTMQTDIAKISQENISTVGGGLLRQARKEQEVDYKNSIKNPKNVFYIILALLFLFIGAFGLGTGIIKFIPETATVFFKSANPSEKSIIVIDALEKPIEITKQSVDDIYAKITKIGLQNSSGAYSIIGIPVLDNNQPANLLSYLKPIGAKPLAELTSIGNQSVFYGMSLHPKPSPFIIITLPSYDSGYAVMKSWNKSIVRDIGIWMMIDPNTVKNTLTSFESRENIIANNLVTTLYTYENNTPVEPVSDTENAATTPQEAATVDEAAAIAPESISNPAAASESEPDPAAYTEKTPPLQPVEDTPDSSSQVISWMFMDEQTILIVKNTGDIPEILKRFQEKKGMVGAL